jgi:hypothetical protein
MNLFTFPARGPHKDATFPRVTLKLSCFWHRTMIRSTYGLVCVQSSKTLNDAGSGAILLGFGWQWVGVPTCRVTRTPCRD